MEPLYAAHPLVDAERAEVTAFLAAAGGRAPARESAWFAVQAGGVFAVLLGGIGLAARRRRGSARARLLAVGREGGR
jgi:sensor c-di-GMP phosphodiesterase-like protein